MKTHHRKNSSEDLIKEAEAEILNPQHSFDMVIPGEIRIRKDISKCAQWVYALIRNLTRLKGYCWATNETLANELGKSTRTVQRHIASLEKARVITTECVSWQNKTRRRIFLGDFQKMFSHDKNVMHDKNDVHTSLKRTTPLDELNSFSDSSSHSRCFSQASSQAHQDPPFKGEKHEKQARDSSSDEELIVIRPEIDRQPFSERDKLLICMCSKESYQRAVVTAKEKEKSKRFRPRNAARYLAEATVQNAKNSREYLNWKKFVLSCNARGINHMMSPDFLRKHGIA